jgi:hypothetical protein
MKPEKTEITSEWSKGYVVSEYIPNPLLFENKKFDLRLYVLVTNVSPLTAFLYQEGIVRLCTEDYNLSTPSLFAHVTNTSVQKRNVDQKDFRQPSFNEICEFISRKYSQPKFEKLKKDINILLLESLKAFQDTISPSPNSFELYGYDVLIDDALQPWLIEINSSPSLTPTSQDDFIRKEAMLNSLLDKIFATNFSKNQHFQFVQL